MESASWESLPLVSSPQARAVSGEGYRVSHVLYSCNSLLATCLLLVVAQFVLHVILAFPGETDQSGLPSRQGKPRRRRRRRPGWQWGQLPTFPAGKMQAALQSFPGAWGVAPV